MSMILAFVLGLVLGVLLVLPAVLWREMAHRQASLQIEIWKKATSVVEERLSWTEGRLSDAEQRCRYLEDRANEVIVQLHESEKMRLVIEERVSMLSENQSGHIYAGFAPRSDLIRRVIEENVEIYKRLRTVYGVDPNPFQFHVLLRHQKKTISLPPSTEEPNSGSKNTVETFPPPPPPKE